MADDIDVEQVLPLTGARRTRFDATHRHAVRSEGGDQVMHRTRPVMRRQHQRGTVTSAGAWQAIAQHQKAGAVAAVVLDAGIDDLQAIAVGRNGRADGSAVWLLRCTPRRLGIGGQGHALGAGQVGIEPAMALRQRLRMGIDPLHAIAMTTAGHQVLMHPQFNLATDDEAGAEQQIECAGDHALGRVLHRHHGKVGAATLGTAEHLIDGSAGHALDRMTEMLIQRHFAERPLRPEIAHRQRLLQAATGRHHFHQHLADCGIRQRAGIGTTGVVQHLRLALRPVSRCAALGMADGLGMAGTLVQQLHQLQIQGINRGAMARDVLAILVL